MTDFRPADERVLDEKIRIRHLMTLPPPHPDRDGCAVFDELDLVETEGAQILLASMWSDGTTRRVGPKTTRAEAIQMAAALLGNGQGSLPDVLFKLALGVLALSSDAERSRGFRLRELRASDVATREVL